MTPFPVEALFCGALAPLGPHGASSGISKQRMPGPWIVTPTGISGDHQGDTKHHGGIEKAIHHYPYDHYAAWRAENAAIAVFHNPPAFGENLSTVGIIEDDVCVGDVFRLGEAILQISQGRQPCWRINAFSGWPALAHRVQVTGRTGWYYRVLQPGQVHTGDLLALDHRPRPDWSVARLMRTMFARSVDRDELRLMSDVPELSENWRRTVMKRLETGEAEDARTRLEPPKETPETPPPSCKKSKWSASS